MQGTGEGETQDHGRTDGTRRERTETNRKWWERRFLLNIHHQSSSAAGNNNNLCAVTMVTGQTAVNMTAEAAVCPPRAGTSQHNRSHTHICRWGCWRTTDCCPGRRSSSRRSAQSQTDTQTSGFLHSRSSPLLECRREESQGLHNSLCRFLERKGAGGGGKQESNWTISDFR